MLNRKILLCSLVLLLTAFSNVAFAIAPYASIVAYNELIPSTGGNNTPNVSTLGVLDIINMTPWDISIGKGPVNTPKMLNGMTTGSWNSFWLAGFNKPSNKGNFGGSFAFHSYQVALNNLNNAWVLDNKQSGFSQPILYDTIPIVFNSNSFNSTDSKTIALNFTATSTEGFDVSYNSGINNFPATALSFGDGTNNYGWQSNDTMIYSGSSWKNTTHFFTLQGLGTTANGWKPIASNLGGINTHNNGMDGSAPNTTVKGPTYLNISGLAYPNFSKVAGDGQNLDLVVIIQACGFSDMQLIFMAVPTSNDGFLKGL